MKILEKILALIRKNRKPGQPDVEVNLAPLAKRLARKKQIPRPRPRF